MSYVCVICEESLSFKDPSVNETSGSRQIYVTQCGHVFHTSCLNDWFAAQKRQQSESHQYNPRTQVYSSTCPSCQCLILPAKCMRIYPTEEHSLNESTTVPILGTKTKAELNKEISKLNKKLSELGAESKNVEAGLLNSLQMMSIEKESVDLAYHRLERKLSEQTISSGGAINTILNKGPSSHAATTISEIDFSQATNTSETDIEPMVKTKGGLKRNDQVVWMHGDSTEVGRVLWLGQIDGSILAGIEFVNPIGNPSGIPVINGRKAFTCHVDYGRVVPVKELILYKDYHGSDPEPTSQQRREPVGSSLEREFHSLPEIIRFSGLPIRKPSKSTATRLS